MKKDRIILLLVIVVIVLSILFVTGVGYAVENDNILIINKQKHLELGQTDFNVVFSGEPIYKGNGCVKLEIIGSRTATIDVKELNKVGDSVTTIFTLENKSDYIYSDIYADITNTNTEYFKVTTSVSDKKISPKNGKTKIEINVQLIKLPIYKEETSNICINIFACPIN